MNISTPNDLLIKFLQASPEQQAAIDSILKGEPIAKPTENKERVLLGMSEAARFLGVSRATLWRMVKAGRLEKVELLPGSFRLRRIDLEAIVSKSKE